MISLITIISLNDWWNDSDEYCVERVDGMILMNIVLNVLIELF